MLAQGDAGSEVGLDVQRCPECGALIAGGQPACQRLFDELTLTAYHDLRYARLRDLALDAYCLQHLEPYCHSAKSFAAHLTRLCCGLERGADPQIYAAIQHWLNGARAVEKPYLSGDRGGMTIADVQSVPAGDAQLELIQAWVHAVWAAYGVHHTRARDWIEEALAGAGSQHR